MRAQINVSSNSVLQISTKISNAQTFFTHTATQIMHDIFMMGAPSPQHFTSSMVPSLTGAPRKNPKNPRTVPM